MPTGCVSVIRSELDGSRVELLSKLQRQAWRVQYSLDECLIVKAFGKCSNFAKELNWLFKVAEGYMKEGLPLLTEVTELKIGYYALRPHVARDNGAEWAGPVYGLNICMADLAAMVKWAEGQHKEKKLLLVPELRVEQESGRVVSTAIAKGAPGHCFKPAEYITGTALVFLESALDISDFEIGDSEGLPGLEILMTALGEDRVVDVDVSNRGMADKGVVRARIKCAIRHEKAMRSTIKKLVRQTAGSGKCMEFETSEGVMAVKFHSSHTVRELEGDAGGGFGSPFRPSPEDQAEVRRKEAILLDLQAHQVKSAAALEQVIDQVQKLAVQQEQAQAHSREVHDALAAQHERDQAHARELHASLAAEQAVALNTVNRLASIFADHMDRELRAPARLGEAPVVNTPGSAAPASGMSLGVSTTWTPSDCIVSVMPVQASDRGGQHRPDGDGARRVVVGRGEEHGGRRGAGCREPGAAWTQKAEAHLSGAVPGGVHVGVRQVPTGQGRACFETVNNQRVRVRQGGSGLTVGQRPHIRTLGFRKGCLFALCLATGTSPTRGAYVNQDHRYAGGHLVDFLSTRDLKNEGGGDLLSAGSPHRVGSGFALAFEYRGSATQVCCWRDAGIGWQSGSTSACKPRKDCRLASLAAGALASSSVWDKRGDDGVVFLEGCQPRLHCMEDVRQGHSRPFLGGRDGGLDGLCVGLGRCCGGAALAGLAQEEACVLIGGPCELQEEIGGAGVVEHGPTRDYDRLRLEGTGAFAMYGEYIDESICSIMCTSHGRRGEGECGPHPYAFGWRTPGCCRWFWLYPSRGLGAKSGDVPGGGRRVWGASRCTLGQRKTLLWGRSGSSVLSGGIAGSRRLQGRGCSQTLDAGTWEIVGWPWCDGKPSQHQGEYAYGEPPAYSGAAAARLRGQGLCLGSQCSRLGLAYGGSTDGQASCQDRSQSGDRFCGQRHRGAGRSYGGGGAAFLRGWRSDGMAACSQSDSLRIPNVRHRFYGSCSRQLARGSLQVRARRGGQCYGGEGSAGGVGGQTSKEHGQCSGRWHSEGAQGLTGQVGSDDAKFQVRAVVTSQHYSAGERSAHCAVGTCVGGVPGFVAAGALGATASDHDRMRRRHAAAWPAQAVVYATRAGRGLAGMVMVVPAHLPKSDTGWLCSQAEGVDCGNMAWMILVGSLLTMAGRCRWSWAKLTMRRRLGPRGQSEGMREEGLVGPPLRGGRQTSWGGLARKRMGRDVYDGLDDHTELMGTQKAFRLRLRGGGPRHEQHAQGLGQAASQGPCTEASSVPAEQLWQGRCLCWNARQLLVPAGLHRSGGGEDPGAAGRKLEFLERQIDWHAPWIVALMEVGGGLDRLRALRAWFKTRGLTNMVFLMGEGGSAPSKGSEHGAGILTNGITVACHRDVSILSARRIAFRTFAVTALHKSSLTRLSIVILHGASIESSSEDAEREAASGPASFSAQLAAAAEWCSAHDGVILMDANRVPCRSWRAPAPAHLSRGDMALRSLCGWSCDCCVAAVNSERCPGATLIGSQLSVQGEPLWTRQGVVEGRVVRSRLDVGLAFGKAESQWTTASLVEPTLRSSVGCDRVSDHALMVFELRLLGSGLRGEDRPLPVRLGPFPGGGAAPGKMSAWTLMADITSAQAFRDELLEGLSQAEQAGRSQVTVLVSLLRRAGEEAVLALQARERERNKEGARRKAYDDRSEAQSWHKRLCLAQSLAHTGGRLSKADWGTLFHPRSGLHKWCKSTSATDVARIPWAEVVLRCRRQLSRANKFARNRKDSEDAWLASKCQIIEAQSDGGDMAAHVRTIWRLIGRRSEHTKVHTVHRGDRKDAQQITVDDPEFLRELGRIGESFVSSLDKGSVPEAFRAWLEVFGSPHDELAGSSGGAWKLENEFTFELFSKILLQMQGKAVGAGGLSVELLIASGRDIQWLFYQALLRDVRVGCLATAWRKVLYVLLRKPPPNDASIVAQRREIALMPQDLKILLQGIRRAAYEKISVSLDAAQFGWRKGMGCADPSLALACVLDQTRRLQHKAWLLYIDLANFFPAINRSIACSSELFMGLPEEVADLLGQIYGGQRGFPSRVECQYESDAGLGAPFENNMGRLMGCPVSPDSAKILLNSVLLAIRASVKGIKLWPFSGDEVSQLAFADDWVGTFEDVNELRKALEIWLAWAEVVGARLGIKGLVKTVVTGVDFSSGSARTPPDPGLQDLEGRRIPLLPCDELYKHLGVPRAARADGERSWTGYKGVQGIRDKLRAGVARLRQLRPGKTSPEQFICISNVLLGGLGGFYLQSSVASLLELEQIEREWRRCFNRFTRRDFASRALPLYMPSANWKKGRTHLARIGTAALYTAVEKAMSDTVDSPARAAVRSAIALSLHQWGCRSAPNEWKWSHLRKPLEKATSRKGARFIGDAWMLGCLLLEEGRSPEKNKACRDEMLRQNAWGRWRGLSVNDHQGGGPLRETGAHWHHSSRLLFEPRDQGGLGLDFRPLLVQAGVCEVSQMTTNPFMNSADGGRWLLDKKVVEQRTGRRVSAAMWKQWLDVIRVLKARQVSPPRPDWACTRRLRCYPMGTRTARGRNAFKDVASVLRKQRLGLRGHFSASHYATIFRTAFRPAAGSSAEGSSCLRSGVASRVLTTVGWRLDKDGLEHFEQWKGGAVDRPLSFDARWQEAAADLCATVKFREGDGWPLDGQSGVEIGLSDVERWPPAPQLAIRARLTLGKDALTVNRSFGEKISAARVAEDVQRDNWACVCDLQARMAFTHAFATDASEGEAPRVEGESGLDAWGWPRRRTAAAVVAHSGVVEGGCLAENLPADSYLGELAALVEALKRVPEGSRVLLVLDSTSPVRAWLSFRRKGDRARRQYQAAFGLQLLDDQIRRLELVYFLWQRSHAGSPMNEVADLAAEKFRLEGAEPVVIEAFSGAVADMWPSRASGNLFAWAVQACKEAVHDRLRTGGAHAIDPEEDEWEFGLLQGAVGAAAALMREDKLMVADAGHGMGRRERDAASVKCSLGCDVSGGTWHHYLFHCEHPQLLNDRRSWTRWIHGHRCSFDSLGTQNQVTALLSLMPSLNVNARPCNSLRCAKSDLRAVRRLLSGFVSRDLDRDDSGSESRNSVRLLVTGGLRLLCKAAELEAEARLLVDKTIRCNRLLLRVMHAWRLVIVKGNPLRVAALRQMRRVREAGSQIWSDGQRPAVLPGGWSPERFKDVVTSHLIRARDEIDRYFPDLGEEAIVWWFLQMKLRGWWSRRRPGFAKTVPWQAWTVSLEAARNVVRKGVGGFGNAAHISWSWVGEGAEMMEINTPACSADDGGGGTVHVSILPLHFEAGRAFFSLGGVKKLRGVLEVIKRANAESRLNNMRRGLANFRQYGTCSGSEPLPVAEEEKITVIIGRRKRTCRSTQEWNEGRRADKRGRWAVDEISAVRRRAGSRGWEVLVLWAGGHDPSWVRLTDLDRGLREEAREMISEAQKVGQGEDAPTLGKRRRAQRGANSQGKRPAVATKRSPRLIEVEERKRKLLTAIVPFTGQAATTSSKKKRQGDMFRVRRAWGLHVRENVEVVHVTWEDGDGRDPSVIPVGWLSEDLQLEVRRDADRARAAADYAGPSSVHPFFSSWGCSVASSSSAIE